MTQNNRNLALSILVVSVFILGCALHFYRGYYSSSIRTGHAFGADDAFISYRYGWNLAHYGILSWNESGFRRVEGFTNPLWVYCSAIPALWGDKDLVYPALTLLSVLVSGAALFVLCRLLLQSDGASMLNITGMLLLACSPVVWLHSTSGLESGIFGFLIGIVAWFAVAYSGPDEYRIGLIQFVVVLFIVLLRSDGFVYVLPVLIASAIMRKKSWIHILSALILGVAILTAWRLVAFDSLIPNTAIAKLNFGLHDRQYVGREILARVLLTSGIGGFLVLGAVGLSLVRNWKMMVASCIIEVVWMGYFVYIGGDHFLERHLIGLAVFSAAISAPLWGMLGRPSSLILALGMLAFIVAPVVLGDSRFLYREKKMPDVWVKMGKLVSEQREKYGTVVCGPAGKIPFYSGEDFVDVIGLNDPELARIPMASFWPGHSSGSMQIAMEIAHNQSRDKVTYYVAFPDNRNPLFNAIDSQSVLMWFDNVNPNVGAVGNIPMSLLSETRKRPYSISMLVAQKD